MAARKEITEALLVAGAAEEGPPLPIGFGVNLGGDAQPTAKKAVEEPAAGGEAMAKGAAEGVACRGETEAIPGGEGEAMPGGEAVATAGGEAMAKGAAEGVTCGGEADAPPPGGEVEAAPGGEAVAPAAKKAKVEAPKPHKSAMKLSDEDEFTISFAVEHFKIEDLRPEFCEVRR